MKMLKKKKCFDCKIFTDPTISNNITSF